MFYRVVGISRATFQYSIYSCGGIDNLDVCVVGRRSAKWDATSEYVD
jgi:hypothetical protein